MSQQGNDEATSRTPSEPPSVYGTPPADGAPPAYGTPADGTPQPYGAPPYGAPPAYGTPPDQGTTPFDAVPPTSPYQALQPYPAQGYPGQWPAYPESSQAVLALVLGIIGVFVFWPVSPAAWVIGRKEVRAVDAGRRNPANRGVGLTGMVMGIIGTVLLALGVVFFVVVIVVLASVSTAGYSG